MGSWREMCYSKDTHDTIICHYEGSATANLKDDVQFLLAFYDYGYWKFIISCLRLQRSYIVSFLFRDA